LLYVSSGFFAVWGNRVPRICVLFLVGLFPQPPLLVFIPSLPGIKLRHIVDVPLNTKKKQTNMFLILEDEQEAIISVEI